MTDEKKDCGLIEGDVGLTEGEMDFEGLSVAWSPF